MVERITYQTPENDFIVARLAPERLESEVEVARGNDRLVPGLGTLDGRSSRPDARVGGSGRSWWRRHREHHRRPV
jgi:hypothetical protein